MPSTARINPYDLNQPRQVDLLTPLGLQVNSGSGDLELWQCEATTTVKADIQRPLNDIKAGENGVLRRDPYDRDKLRYIQNRQLEEGSHLDPRNNKDREIKTQREIVDDIVNAYSVNYEGDFPDIVLQSRAVYVRSQNLPRSVLDLPAFDGADGYLYVQDSSGNYAHVFRKWLNIPLANPYYIMRGELWDKGVIPMGVRHPVLRKIAGVLQTRNACTEVVPWGNLDDSTIKAIERSLIGKRWHQDLAHPIKMDWNASTVVGQGQIYHLEKREVDIALREYEI
jgi:hypothetical protein